MLEALGVDTSKSAEPDRDRRGARAPRRALADARQRAGAAEPQPHPHRHLPAPELSSATPTTSAGCSTIRSRPTCRTSRRPATMRGPRSSSPRWRERVAVDRRRLDRRGLRPRRAQLRQHQHHRREFRLRPVALPADLRSGLHRRLFRRDRALCLRPPARCAGLEPDAARRSACCRSASTPGIEAALNSFWPAFQRSDVERGSTAARPRVARRRGRLRAGGRRSSPSSTRARSATSSSGSTGAAAC